MDALFYKQKSGENSELVVDGWSENTPSSSDSDRLRKAKRK